MIALDAVRVEGDARAIGHAATRALLGELAAYPKPGLVSFIDNGSHADMTASHFVRSAFVLRRAFSAMAAAGEANEGFDRLRRLGVEAEVAMRRATGGPNTHRGAIFGLGLLAAAAGCAGAHAGNLGEIVRQRWGAYILAHRRDPASHGSKVTRELGHGGAQAEAAAGFPSVYQVALPAYRDVLRAGGTGQHAAVQAFFALLATVNDTNLVHRGGVAGLHFVQEIARDYVANGGVLEDRTLNRAVHIHHALVARRLSPGGSADLLAATFFIAGR